MSGFNVSIFRNNENIGVLSKGEVISLDFEQLDRANVADTIQVGLYSNTGRISFVDRHNLKRLLDNSISLDDFLVIISFANNATTKRLCTMYVDDYDYNEVTSVLTLSLTDNLTKLQDKEISRIYPFYPTSLSELASSIADQAEIKSIVVANDITVDCPDIRAQSAWSALNEICAANLLRGFYTANGTLNLTRDDKNPSANTSNPIIIQPRHIINIQPVSSPRHNTSRKYKIEQTVRIKKSGAIQDRTATFTAYDIETTYDESNNNKPVYSFPWVGTGVSSITKIGENGMYATFGIQLPDTIYSLDTLPQFELSNKGIDDHRFPYTTHTSTRNGSVHPSYFGDKSVYWDTVHNVANFALSRASFVGSHPVVVHQATVMAAGEWYEERTQSISRSYSNDTNYIATLPSSTLMQSASHAKEMIEHLRERLWFGVDTVEIECLMNDYYFENGDIALSSEMSQCFSKYDVVVPYIMRKGVTEPYRTYADGTPKKFLIVGIKYSQLGIPRQTLYLQEYAPPNLFGTLSFNRVINRPNNDITLSFGDDDAVYGYFLNRSLEIERRKVSSIGIYTAETDENVPIEIDSDNGLHLWYDGSRWWFDVDGAYYEVSDYEEMMGDIYTLFEIEQNPIIVTEEQKKWFNDNTTLTF